MTEAPCAPRPAGLGLVPLLGLFLLVAAVYAPSLRYGFIYDDHELIVKPPPPQTLGEVLRVFGERHWRDLPYYRPVARLTMVGQSALHGQNPAPYHAFNVAAIGVAAVLAYGLLRLRALGIHPVPAFLGAAFFALHPVASCTVYPICSGRETLLPALFTIAAAYAWLRSREPAWRAAATLLFALALFSKEQAVIVPLLFVLADALSLSPGGRPRGLRAWGVRYLPVLVTLAAYAVIRWRLFEGTGEHRLAVLDMPAGPLFSLAYFVQTALAPFVELVYEPSLAVWLDPIRLGSSLLLLSLLAIWLRVCWPAVARPAGFWLGWTLLALLPTANILSQQTQFAERWGWLSLAGLTGLLATLASQVWRSRAWHPVLVSAGVLMVAVSAAISVMRGPSYRNDVAFHTQWLRTNPESDQAHRSLGWALLEEGQPAAAEHHLRRAIRLNPHFAETWNNLGNALNLQGRSGEAAELYARALQIDPRLAEAHNNLAMLLAGAGDLDQAEAHFRQALESRPWYSEAHNGLGIVLAAQERFEEARHEFEQALRINPRNAEAHNNLGNVLAALGEHDRAATHFQQVLRLRPDHRAARESLQRLRATGTAPSEP